MKRALALILLLAGCAARPATVVPAAETLLTIPMRDEQGTLRHLTARLCRPPGPWPTPLVVINHGAPATLERAPLMAPTSCASPPARWFEARGYAVLFALRRGFGASTGPIASSGRCDDPDYIAAGLADARDIAAIVSHGQSLPGIARDGTVVVGQSTGGWAVIAYDTLPHPPLAGIIVMAGGRGARAGAEPCRADRLAEAAGAFGATSRTPMLWVYARSDLLFGPRVAAAMHTAFTRAGGRAELVQPEFRGVDGHRLFYADGGGAVWGPIVDDYLEIGKGRLAQASLQDFTK